MAKQQEKGKGYINNNEFYELILERKEHLKTNPDLPLNEVVTIIKISIYHKKIAISTGMTVSGLELYQDFDDRLCRTKLVVKINAKAFEEYYDTVTFGVHRNILFGDYRETIKYMAAIIGYEVIEEHKHSKYTDIINY